MCSNDLTDFIKILLAPLVLLILSIYAMLQFTQNVGVTRTHGRLRLWYARYFHRHLSAEKEMRLEILTRRGYLNLQFTQSLTIVKHKALEFYRHHYYV
jgi:hypothetical protein